MKKDLNRNDSEQDGLPSNKNQGNVKSYKRNKGKYLKRVVGFLKVPTAVFVSYQLIFAYILNQTTDAYGSKSLEKNDVELCKLKGIEKLLFGANSHAVSGANKGECEQKRCHWLITHNVFEPPECAKDDNGGFLMCDTPTPVILNVFKHKVHARVPVQILNLSDMKRINIVYSLGSSATTHGHLCLTNHYLYEKSKKTKYILIKIEGTNESLSGSVARSGYEENHTFILEEVTVTKTNAAAISRVFVNGHIHNNFSIDSNTKALKISQVKLALNSIWTISWDSNHYISRFDCHPETFVNATKQRCLKRGCLWKKVAIPDVPPCYYPDKYGAYKIKSDLMKTSDGEKLLLTRMNKPTLFKDPVQNIKFEIYRQSDHQLRIKLYDAGSARYEVPFAIGGVESGQSSNPMYEVSYQNKPFSFQIFRKSTKELILDTSVGALIFEDQFLQISFATSTTYMYGIGEAEHKNYKHDFYWTTQGLFASRGVVEENSNLYGVHPFHLAMERSGHSHGILLLNSNAMEVSLTPLPSVTYRTIGGILDFYIFFGPNPEEVVQQYIRAIGLPVMPPYWALGFQLSKYNYNNISELRKVVEDVRAYKIPYDVQHGDIDYMERRLDFTVDPNRYQGLAKYVDKIRSEYHMRYVCILDHVISANESKGSYPPYDEGVRDDIFIKDHNNKIVYGKLFPDLPGILYDAASYKTKAHVAFPDFFKNSTKTWWNRSMENFYKNALKFDGIWLDLNEPCNANKQQKCPDSKYDKPPYLPKLRAKTLDNKTICMSSKQYNPSTKSFDELHYNLHNMYGWSEAKPTLSACRKATGKRCLIISRSTFPGAGKFTGHWLGDNFGEWSDLGSSIIGMLEFGLFGFPYVGADICGFLVDAEEEMCLRWSQLGSFYPFSRNHAHSKVRRQDPAVWGPNFASSVRKVLLTRYTLLPYLYTLFYHAHTTGSTVVRPLMHEFTKEKKTWSVDRQFLWGSALLITPVLEPKKTYVDAYFPRARWFDYYSGMELLTRGGLIRLSAPKDHINLHVRGGYILPTQEPATTTHMSRKNDFGMIVALDDDYAAQGCLYWDDGESIDSVKNKEYLYTNFSCRKNILENFPVHDMLAESERMILGKVFVLGLKGDIKNVWLQDIQLTTYDQDASSKKLTIKVKLRIKEKFMIRWEVDD